MPSKAQTIRNLVDYGFTVYCGNKAYIVIKDSIGQYLIKCTFNGFCIGLTHQDGETLNGEKFFVSDDSGIDENFIVGEDNEIN